MSKELLNNWAKNQIITRHKNGESISELARYFLVSRQTIRRALKEYGITTHSQDANKVLDLLKKYKLSVKGLEYILRYYHAKYQD